MSTKPNTCQITYDTGSNKQDLNNILDTVVPIADYTALRNYTGRATQVRITSDGIAGFFKYDSTDTTSTDNGGTIIVAGTKRWKRVFDGAANVKWFGAKGDGVVDDTVAIQAALASGNLNILIPSGTYCVTNVLYQTTSYQTFDIHGNLFFDAAGNISPILIVTQTAIGSRRTGAGIIDHNGEQWAAGTGFADVLGGGGGDARGVAVLVMADNSIDDSYTVLNGWDCCFSLGNFNLTTGVQSAGPDCSRVSNLHTSNAGCGKHSWWAAPNGYYFQGVGVNSLTATNFVISNCTDYSSYGGFWADTNGGATGSFVNCTSVDCARGPVWSDAAAGSNQMWYTDGVFGGTITGAGAGWKKTPGGVAFMSGTYSISFVNCSAINPAWIGIALDQNSSGNEITNFRCVGSGGPGVIDAGLKNKFSQITLEDCCKYHGDVAPSGSICPVVAPFETVGQAGGYVEPTISGLVIKSEPVYPSASPTAIKYPYALYARTSSGYVSRIGVGDADILSGTLGRVLCDTGSSVSLVSVTGSTTTVDTYGGDCVFDFKAQGNTAFQLAKTTAGDALITNFENGKQMIFGQAGPGSYAFWVNGIMKFGVNDANIIFGALPTVAPSVTGAIWRDPAAGNAIKIVP